MLFLSQLPEKSTRQKDGISGPSEVKQLAKEANPSNHDMTYTVHY